MHGKKRKSIMNLLKTKTKRAMTKRRKVRIMSPIRRKVKNILLDYRPIRTRKEIETPRIQRMRHPTKGEGYKIWRTAKDTSTGEKE